MQLWRVAEVKRNILRQGCACFSHVSCGVNLQARWGGRLPEIAHGERLRFESMVTRQVQEVFD